MIEKLKSFNPELKLLDVSDSEFSHYGRVLDIGDTKNLSDCLATTPIPESGNRYVASLESLESVDAMDGIKTVFGEMDIQAGYCNGHGYTLNALEYHKCSEVNYSTTGLVLLLGLKEDIKDGNISSDCVKGFYLPPDTAVEIFPTVLHFAPCRISDEGFNCLVVLEKGVNSPLKAKPECLDFEDKLLWMRGKWLICHPDSPQAKAGAFCGISGKNIKLNIKPKEANE